MALGRSPDADWRRGAWAARTTCASHCSAIISEAAGVLRPKDLGSILKSRLFHRSVSVPPSGTPPHIACRGSLERRYRNLVLFRVRVFSVTRCAPMWSCAQWLSRVRLVASRHGLVRTETRELASSYRGMYTARARDRRPSPEQSRELLDIRGNRLRSTGCACSPRGAIARPPNTVPRAPQVDAARGRWSHLVQWKVGHVPHMLEVARSYGPPSHGSRAIIPCSPIVSLPSLATTPSKISLSPSRRSERTD